MAPSLRLKGSKTRKGVCVYLGIAGGSLSPVAAILVCRGSNDGPFFTFADGSFLTRDRFVRAVREALSSAGVDSWGTASVSGPRPRPRVVAFQTL